MIDKPEEEQDLLLCEECGDDCKELFSRSQFNGNHDTRWLCLKKCYKKVHGEDFYDNGDGRTTR